LTSSSSSANFIIMTKEKQMAKSKKYQKRGEGKNEELKEDGSQFFNS